MPNRKLPANEIILALYRSGLSSGEIAERHNVAHATVASFLRRIGEPRRNTQEAAALRTLHGRTNPARFWLGKKQPKEMIEKRVSQIRGDKHWLWGKNLKPVSREWLYEKYVTDGLSTYQIAKMVERNPKNVWTWLRDFGIPLRKREWSTESNTQPYHDKEWLTTEYVTKQRSAEDIAKQFGVTGANIFFYLIHAGIQRRSMDQIRAIKHWGSPGAANGMFGKRGAELANWKGGVTPERQAFHSSLEWASMSRAVWKRDKARCQRCNLRQETKLPPFHIHHIVTFAVRELRAEPTNLVLLCHPCHRFVHSRKNTENLFIRQDEERRSH